MGELNVPPRERDAIKTVDVVDLRGLVDECLRDERSDALRSLRLEDCGAYIASRLHAYTKALTDHSAAKAAKKREVTGYSARRAGSDLVAAVELMKQRVEEEEYEDQLFHVEDNVSPPILVSERLSVRVSYRWRRAPEDAWTYGNITFHHAVDLRPDYSVPPPTRKPSAAKLAEVRREQLYREWEHLKSLALYAVKEYFRKDGAGSDIPASFQAKPDPHSRHLNNFSANFWMN